MFLDDLKHFLNLQCKTLSNVFRRSQEMYLLELDNFEKLFLITSWTLLTTRTIKIIENLEQLLLGNYLNLS